MLIEDLIFIRDKEPSLLTVAGDGGAGHGQFYPEIQFDGSIDNRVKAENLLDAVRVFGVSPYADPGVHVMRQLGTSEGEGVGFGRIHHRNLCKDTPLDDQIEVLPLQLFLNAKDLVEDAGLFRIGLLKSEGQNLHFGPFDFGINGEPTGGAFHLDADLFMKSLLIGMGQPVADPSSDIFDDADKLNRDGQEVFPDASKTSKVPGATLLNIRLFNPSRRRTF